MRRSSRPDQGRGRLDGTLGEDLRRPIFLIGRRQAMSRRLRRNYGWMFLILLAAWVLKITSPKLQPGGAPAEFALSPFEWLGNAAISPLPGWLVAAVVASVLPAGSSRRRFAVTPGASSATAACTCSATCATLLRP